MSNFTEQQLAAAALADSYIQIILTTKPELLIPGPAQTDPGGAPNDTASMNQALRLSQFRHHLIWQLEKQPINVESEED